MVLSLDLKFVEWRSGESGRPPGRWAQSAPGNKARFGQTPPMLCGQRRWRSRQSGKRRNIEGRAGGQAKGARIALLLVAGCPGIDLDDGLAETGTHLDPEAVLVRHRHKARWHGHAHQQRGCQKEQQQGRVKAAQQAHRQEAARPIACGGKLAGIKFDEYCRALSEHSGEQEFRIELFTDLEGDIRNLCKAITCIETVRAIIVGIDR